MSSINSNYRNSEYMYLYLEKYVRITPGLSIIRTFFGRVVPENRELAQIFDAKDFQWKKCSRSDLKGDCLYIISYDDFKDFYLPKLRKKEV